MSNPAEQQAIKTPAKRLAEPRNDVNKRLPKFGARPRSYQGTENKLYNSNAATHTPEAFDKLVGRFSDLTHDEADPFFSPISSKHKCYLSITNQEQRATSVGIRDNLERLNTETGSRKENIEALKAQREQGKVEFWALGDKVERLCLDNADLCKESRALKDKVERLSSDNADLRSDNTDLRNLIFIV